jgi:uracil phosphoribosyltransferase
MTFKTYPQFPNFIQIEHPLIQYKLALLRDRHTNRKLFKELVEELSILLGYEALRDLATKIRTIHTPLESFDGPDLEDTRFLITPILRAGMGMAEGLLKLLPVARVGHIGLYRDEKTLEAISYYFKLPPQCEDDLCLVCDPMLATGHSSSAALDKLKQKNIKKIKFICLLAAPEGIQYVLAHHPDVTIYSAILDRQLNEHGYILPGLGDAGDRLWSNK